MSTQVKQFLGTRFSAGGALIVTGGLLLLQLGDRLFANTMTNWAYAEITGPTILTGAGALSVHRDRHANIGHYAT
jgi:hypothetical protein